MDAKKFESVLIDGVRVLLPEPDVVPRTTLVGNAELLMRCEAAWSECGGDPLHFNLVGPPGVGKNEIVYALARKLGQPLYTMLGTADLMPEDIVATGRIADGQRIEYVASPLTAAAVRGGIAFFDEAAKAPARAMAPLASLLDNRRTLTSVLAGFTIRAHPSFRFCAATNDTDAATGGLPAFLDERLRPSFRVDYPSAEQSVVIALGRTEIIDEALMDEFRRWALRQTNLSPRRAIALLGFAARLANYPQNGTRPSAASVIAQAVQAVTSNEHLQ